MNSVCKLSFSRLLAVLAITLLAGIPAVAQSAPSDPTSDAGTHWYGTYEGGHENISLSSGNLSFCIPLISLKGPNSHNLTIPLCYNSQFLQAAQVQNSVSFGPVLAYFPWTWAPNTPSGDTTPKLGVGWTLTGAPAYYESPSTSISGSPVEYMPDGATYTFGGTVGPDGSNADTFMQMPGLNSSHQSLWMKDGARFDLTGWGSSSCAASGCAKEWFPDGASISWTNNSVTDALGRTITESSGSTFSGSNTTSSTAYVQFQYPDPVSTGTLQTVTVEMQTMQFSCSYNQANNIYGEVGSGGFINTNGQYVPDDGPYSMPTAIILPNGLTYTFQYDSCGMLRKVTYPTGGYTRYDYTAEPLTYECLGAGSNACDIEYYQNQVVAKHVCPVPAMTIDATSASAFNSGSGQCPVAEQTTTYTPTLYNVAGQVNEQNTVQDPVGNKVVYQFSEGNIVVTGDPQVETSRQYYDASGKLWKTIATQYATTTAPGSTYSDGSAGPGTGISSPALPTIQTTTLDNGMVSQIQWSYDISNPALNDSVLIEERDYDYGQGTPGSLLKRTDYGWLHRLNPSAYGWPNPGNSANHICDHKTSETVYDGNGKMLENTTYKYDGNNGGGQGLLTSKTEWRSTDGASLTTNYQYNGSFGNITQKTDPNGNTTQYIYTDNYADGTNRSSNAFLTKTIDPLGHVTQNQYYWGGGLAAATCGENFSGSCVAGLTSGSDYASYTYDLMGRKTSTTTGDGGKTTTCYSDLGGTGCSTQGYPLQVTSTETISSGESKISISLAMHPINGLPAETTQLNSDPSCPSGTVNVDTAYDADERKSTVTNPYCSNNPNAPTSGTTTYTYDGLSREVKVTHPDGTNAANTYTGRAVLSADEGNGAHNVQRISQTDALGRLIYVCELTVQTQQGSSNNTPSSCGLDVSGSGFLATYGYDALNSNGPLDSLTSVTQGGVSRSFIYDSLGELRSATNPESGTTTYAYDKDSNLISKTDAKSIVTYYTYDALNRLLSKTYSDGTTPSACFEYDQNASGRGIGRLTTEWTQMETCPSAPPSSGVLTQRTFAAYDPLGRVTADQQCAALGNCTGTSVDTLNYGYDLAGDVTSFGNGLTGTSALSFTGQYNSAGRLSMLSGPQSGGSSQTTTLFEATAYTPSGALANAQMGVGANNSGISFRRDYNSRLLPIDEVDTVGQTPGVATVQITGTEQTGNGYGPGYSYGSVTFSGSENCPSSGCDSGAFLVFVGAQQSGQYSSPYTIDYGQYDTPESLAVALAEQLNCSNSPVVGYAVGATVYLVSCSATSTNWSLSAFLTGYSYEGQYAPSFSVTTSGSSLTSMSSSFTIPSNPGYMNPTASAVSFYGTEQSGQTGSLLFMVSAGSTNNPPLKSIEISWGSSSTPSTLASALASQFSPCSSSNTGFTAAVDNSWGPSGPTVVLSSCNSTTTYAIYAAIAGYSPQTSNSTPSFVAITNGSWSGDSGNYGPTTIYDAGTVSLNVNGRQIASTSYGSSSTPTSIASALVSNGANNGLVTLSSSGANITMTALGNGTVTDYSYLLVSSSSVFSSPSFSASTASGSLTGGTSAPLYNWAISNYAPNGDVLAMTDSVMGTWSYSYDDFNRLTSGSATAGADNGLTLGWTYDRYGNRWAQNATGSGNVSAVQPQLSFSGNNNRVDGWSYDADGNLLNDGRNNYVYDAEGRIVSLNGQPTYVYDAEGRRVAKYSGSTLTAHYLLDLGGNQITELNSSGNWVHSNVFAPGGRMLATYEGPSGPVPNTYHFHLTDWLGTNRMQTNAAGSQEEVCYSYPFGDGLSCTGTDATEHHFTGKERDTESGLDYFEARYLNSNLGRFMTPDWNAKAEDEDPVPYASLEDPQSLNLYAYVRNNPVDRVDADGHIDGATADEFIETAYRAEATTEVVCPECTPLVAAAAVVTTGVALYQHRDDIAATAQSLGNKIASFFKKSPPPAPSKGQTSNAEEGSQEHTKGARGSTYDKHTRTRSGERQPPNYKSYKRYTQPSGEKKKDQERKYFRKDRDGDSTSGSNDDSGGGSNQQSNQQSDQGSDQSSGQRSDQGGNGH